MSEDSFETATATTPGIDNPDEMGGGQEEEIESQTSEIFDVVYSCLRCGTDVSNTELSRLPEIKCICGFRVFTKVRPPVVKSVKAI